MRAPLVGLLTCGLVALFLSNRIIGQELRRYATYSDVEAVLQQFHDDVPLAVRPVPGLRLDRAWASWIEQHDGAIRARLAQGDQDTILNWLMFGTTFTAQPRALVADPTDALALERLRGIVGARTDDLIAALQSPGSDERRLFARGFFESNGFGLSTPGQRAELRAHLLRALLQVAIEQERLASAFAAVRQSGDPLQAIAASQRMYATRGLSLDTALEPNYAMARALGELKRTGQVGAGAFQRIGIVGAGLDFADKDAGFDAYPVQTVQPFAVMDAVRQLDLASSVGTLDVVALDISPRIVEHIARMRARAAEGIPYVITLPLPRGRPWTGDFRAYWREVGTRLGPPVTPVSDDVLAQLAEVRALQIPPSVVGRVSAMDLDIVAQRFDGPPFDLIVATNVLVYYSPFEQALALANIASILRDGGWLLSNTVLPEVAGLAMEVVDIQTTTYADDGVKDVIVAYRKGRR